MAALAQDNEAGLDGVRAMKNLFRRMADDDIGFQFNLPFLCARANRDETALEALAPFIQDRMKLLSLIHICD